MHTPLEQKNNFEDAMDKFLDEQDRQSAKGFMMNKSLENMYEEGELTIDVFEDNNNIVIKSAIAGIRPEDIDISINNDMLTIRGKREHDEKVDEKNYFYRECYWGNFSRTIILPCEVKSSKVIARLKNGVLTIKIPKAKINKTASIKVIEEN